MTNAFEQLKAVRQQLAKSYINQNPSKVSSKWEHDEKRVGKMYRTTVEALHRDTNDVMALAIGDALSKCRPSQRCGLVFCPLCRSKKAGELYQKATSKFANVAKDDLRFLTIIHSIQYSIDDIPDALGKHRGQLNRCFNNFASDLRVMGFFEVDLKSPDMYRGQYRDSSGVLKEHRPHARDLFEGLGLNLDDDDLPEKFYLPHLHAIVDVSSLGGSKLNSDAILKKTFPHSYQCRVSPLKDSQTKDEALERICAYMVKSRLQYSDNIFAEDPARSTKSVYKAAYPDADIIDFCKLAKANHNFRMLKYDYKL